MAVRELSSFGVMVRHYRRALGLTQEELAERAGLSERVIRDIERGHKHIPRKDTVQLLADALDLEGAKREEFVHSVHRVGEQVRSRAFTANRTSLPDDPTPFIGREREIQEISDMLQRPMVRLLTLTGPGGIGKTRLALQVAGQLRDGFSDDAYFVSLAPIHDPDLVPTAVALALGLEEREGPSLLDTLTASLQARHLLLVLDNFEHVAPAVDVIAHILASCPRLSILVTSRVVLHLAAEHEYPVPSLSVPDPKQVSDLEVLDQYDAVALFVERARAVRPAFTLDQANARDVVEICAQLDGLPLAIELAAARLRLLPPRSLVERLSQRLSLLTGGPRDRPARHQTLRAAIDWSYSLLAPEEQRLFARLSVFAGGCTLEAAERVCNRDGDLEIDVFDGMNSLAEQSLIREQGEDEPRCVMLETIRQYSAEHLGQAEEADVRRQHAVYYLQVAEEAAEELVGPGRVEWLDRLESEHDNLRKALRWAQETGESALGLRLAIALGRFWEARGHVSEGRRWLAELLALAGTEMPERRIPALKTAALLAQAHQDLRSVHELLEQSLDLIAELGDQRARVEVLIQIGRMASAGSPDQAKEPLEQGLALARLLGDTALIISALFHLALMKRSHGDATGALPLAEESLLLARELGDPKAMGLTLTNLVWTLGSTGDRGRVRALLAESMALLRSPGFYLDAENREWIVGLGAAARCQGEYEAAQALCDQAVELSLEAGDRGSAAHFWVSLGLLEREQGRYDQAGMLLRKALVEFEELGDSGGMARALIGLGDLARDQGDADDTITFSQRSQELFRRLHASKYVGFSLHNLAMAAWVQGDHLRAERLLSDAVTVLAIPEIGAEVLVSSGLVALDQCEYARAEQTFTEILRRWAGNMIFITAPILEGMAGVAVGRGRMEQAVRLLGAADALRCSIGTPLMPLHRPLHERRVAAARTALGEEQFQQGWAAGQTMTMEQAIEEALHEPSGHENREGVEFEVLTEDRSHVAPDSEPGN